MINWEQLFSKPITSFTKSQKEQAYNWDTCPVARYHPKMIDQVQGLKRISAKIEVLQDLGLSFGEQVHYNKVEEAKKTFLKIKKWKNST